MAEAALISVVGGLLKTLWDKFQQAKDIARVTDLEFQMLKGFIEQVNTISKLLGSHSDNGTNLREALAQAETTLQLWCSKDSGFLSRSSDERYGELKDLRQSVETAIDLEKLIMQTVQHGEMHGKEIKAHWDSAINHSSNQGHSVETALDLEKLRMQEQHEKNVESILGKLIEQGQAENPPKKDPKKITSSKGKPSGSQVGTKIKDKDQSKPRAKSADRGKPSKDRIPDSPSQLPPQGLKLPPQV